MACTLSTHTWHPDPTQPRQVAWLCTPCRNYARASGDLIPLRWEWPGTAVPIPKGRPQHVEIDPDWVSTATAAAERTRIADLADALFFSVFSKVAGSNAHILFRAARRAAIAGKIWCPTGDAELDARLRAWASFEYEHHQSVTLAARERVVEPPLPWLRRPRIDRTPLLPPEPAPPTPAPAFHQDDYERKIAAALKKLANAEAVADALLATLTREHL